MKNKYSFPLAGIVLLLLVMYGCSSSTGTNSDDENPPQVPSGLTLKSIDNGTAMLTWPSVTHDDLKGYYVYWNDDPDALTSHRMFSADNSAEISGLDCDAPYYFAVSAVDKSDNERSLSVRVTGTCEITADITPPPVPTGLYITDSENGAISLKWTPVQAEDLAGYYIYWRGGIEADTLSANRKFIEDITDSIAGLDYDIFYYFAVTAIDKSGNESALSVQVSGRPQNTTPPAPPEGLNIAAVNSEISKINVFWWQNTEPDISHYNVYRAKSPADLADSFLTSVTQENYIDVNVEVGVEYYYRITAVDKGGLESIPSFIVNDKVLPPVVLVSPVNYQYVDDHPTFIWEPVEGATKYKLFLKTSRIGGDIWIVELNKDTVQVPYSGDTNLISGNTYYWQVGSVSKTEINSESKVGTFVVKLVE